MSWPFKLHTWALFGPFLSLQISLSVRGERITYPLETRKKDHFIQPNTILADYVPMLIKYSHNKNTSQGRECWKKTLPTTSADEYLLFISYPMCYAPLSILLTVEFILKVRWNEVTVLGCCARAASNRKKIRATDDCLNNGEKSHLKWS